MANRRIYLVCSVCLPNRAAFEASCLRGELPSRRAAFEASCEDCDDFGLKFESPRILLAKWYATAGWGETEAHLEDWLEEHEHSTSADCPVHYRVEYA